MIVTPDDGAVAMYLLDRLVTEYECQRDTEFLAHDMQQARRFLHEVASRDTSDPGAAPTARGPASTSVEGADDDGR